VSSSHGGFPRLDANLLTAFPFRTHSVPAIANDILTILAVGRAIGPHGVQFCRCLGRCPPVALSQSSPWSRSPFGTQGRNYWPEGEGGTVRGRKGRPRQGGIPPGPPYPCAWAIIGQVHAVECQGQPNALPRATGPTPMRPPSRGPAMEGQERIGVLRIPKNLSPCSRCIHAVILGLRDIPTPMTPHYHGIAGLDQRRCWS
jgi:hypothetical protein